MKRLLIFLLFIICHLSLSNIVAQPISTPLKAGRTAEGITYFLPKTAIRFNLLIEKKTYTPGEYAKYAEKYLGMTGIEQEQQITYSIANYNICQIGVRDTSKCYTVELKGKSETADIKLSEDGILLAINDEPAKLKLPPAFIPAAKKPSIDPHQFQNEDVRSAGSMAKKAEMTMTQILELQEHRQQLITGEADDMPQDENQLRYMIEQIDRQREALTSLFTGATIRDTVEQIITVCPESEVHRATIFRLSKKLGIVDKDDLSGVPYYMTIEDLHRTNSQKYGTPKNNKDGGFYVNVPGRIRLTLHREQQQLASYDIYAGQFGFVELRNGALFKHYVTHMTLNPATGSVEKIHADMNTK
jgi:hypothetical protein